MIPAASTAMTASQSDALRTRSNLLIVDADRPALEDAWPQTGRGRLNAFRRYTGRNGSADPPKRRRLVRFDQQALDPRVLARPVAGVARELGDPVHDVHPGGHAAEDGVLAVEPRRGLGRDDEELAAVRVRA